MDQREIETLQYYLKEYGQQAEVFPASSELMENGRMEAFAAIEALGALVATDDGSPPPDRRRGKPPGKDPRTGKSTPQYRLRCDRGEDKRGCGRVLKDRITEMEASQKKVAEALDKLKTPDERDRKTARTGYTGRHLLGKPGPPPRTTTKITTKNNRGTLVHVFGSQGTFAGRTEPAWRSIGAAAEAASQAPAEQTPLSPPAAPQKNPTLAEKVKILVIDRELVVSEKTLPMRSMNWR